MAKIKDWPLRQSLVVYVLAFALLALALSMLTSALCQQAKDKIWAAYPNVGEKFYLTNSQGERLGDGVYIGDQPVELLPRDEWLLTALDFAQQSCVLFYSAFCIIGAALLFYRRRLKEPLAELRLAADKIAANDLGFAVQYAGRDELGQLCAAFEIMRSRLAGNLAEMWQLAEERRRLNAAFAHDLRTPLTVLKGYNEMLQAGADWQTAAEAMRRQIVRLEAYVESMSHLQRLEQQRPETAALPLAPFLQSLAENARIICRQQGKMLLLPNFEPAVWPEDLQLDPEFVSRVCHNLLDNAARYAQSRVELSFAVQADGLLLRVADDGPGLTAESLARATEPYFSGEADRSEHFGLGLHICKLLCQRHGGWLRLHGAEAQAFFKSLKS